MAVLANGIETMELGSTAWRVIVNANFSAVYTQDEIDTRTVVVTHNEDIQFGVDTKGVVMIDRTTATSYRLYVDNGVLSIEAI